MRTSNLLTLAATLTALAACSGGSSSTSGTSSGSTSGSTSGATSGTTSGATSGRTSGATSGGTSGATSGASSSTSGSTTGTPGPYLPFDGGPHTTPLPTPEAADAGCTLGDPILSDAGTCVQCLSDTDCPAPLVCETDPDAGTSLHCGACSIANPTCPTGTICDTGNTDTCVATCTATSCQGTNGAYCNTNADAGSVGCQRGCRTNADCPASEPTCDTGGSGYCGANCTLMTTGAGGCPAGTVCSYGNFGEPECTFDCRTDAGSCVPGYCDADAGMGTISCVFDACFSDSDCAGSLTPHCVMGSCSQCTTDSDCVALHAGLPICNAGQCTNDCSMDPTGCSLCIDGGGTFTCGCYKNGDCALQTATPDCIALDPDAGLNPDAGAFGICGCTAGSCGSGKVCEDRYVVLSLLSASPPASQCIPSCTAGSCASQYEPVCNTTTGYCVTCGANTDCSADAGTPDCLPLPGDPYGEGQCACTPSACGNDDTCDPNQLVCEPACTYSASGYDSCAYSGFGGGGLCNSETGLCQQCFVGADCAGQSGYSNGGGSYPLQFCSDAGNCYGCNVPSDCPAYAPGCSLGVCGNCVTTSDCQAGNTCNTYGACTTTCTGDAGQCTTDAGTPICFMNACVQCSVDTDCPIAGESCLGGRCELIE